METILNYLNEQKDEIINILSNLIKIPTINPPGENYTMISDLLQIELSKIDLDVRRIIVPDEFLERKGIDPKYPRINIFANWDIGSEKTLHINCHYDVVPVDKDKWKTPPFDPVVEDGKIYGRGACDMKGNIASLLFALKAMKKFNKKPKTNLQISMTCDEETGGELGMKYFAQTDNIKADFAIGEGPSGKYIAIGNKGILWAEIEIIGQSAHSAMNVSKGKNAFERMLDVALEYKKLKDDLKNIKTKFNTIEPEHKYPTLVLGGKAFSGDKINTVPGRASFTIDRRINPEEDINDIKDEILEIAKKLEQNDPDYKINVKFLYEDSPTNFSQDNLFAESFKKIVEKVVSDNVEFVLMSGASDLRYLSKKGVPIVGYSPNGSNYHADNEYVEIKSLIETSAIYYKFFTEFSL